MTKNEFTTLMKFFCSHGSYTRGWNKDSGRYEVYYNPDANIKIRLQHILEFMKCFLNDYERKELFPDE
jgi:hypothetical protein